VNNPALLAAAGLVLLFAVGWTWSTLTERRKRGVQARLAAVLVGTPESALRSNLSVSLRREAPTRATGVLGFLPARTHQYLAMQLAATGNRLNGWHLAFVAGLAALLTAGLLIGVLEFPLLIVAPPVLAAAVGAAVFSLRVAQQRFQRRFLDGFPEALDVIVRAVRAGLPVLDAIEAAVVTVREPVAGEFRKILDELRIGLDLEHVLDNAANRIQVNDFRFFAATLVLQRRTGGSLAETLANLAGLIRRRKEIRMKARTLTAESRATAVLVGALPFVMTGVMYLINPATTSLLFTDPRGKFLLGIGISLLVCGFVLMRAMIRKAFR
jgi:tight adherence protein B